MHQPAVCAKSLTLSVESLKLNKGSCGYNCSWVYQSVRSPKTTCRMQFADAQLFGRTGKRWLKALKDAACRRRSKLLDHEMLSLRLLVKLLKEGKPRTICWDQRLPILMFTDACHERDARDLICGLGGVFIDQSSGRKSFFSCSLKCKQREFLGELSKKQLYLRRKPFVQCWRIWLG